MLICEGTLMQTKFSPSSTVLYTYASPARQFSYWNNPSLSLLEACSRLSDSRGWRVSERHVKIRRVIWERERFGGGFSSRFIFVFEFSQFRGPDCLKAWNRLYLSLLQAGLTRKNIFACGTCSNPGLWSGPEFSRRNQESRQRYSNLESEFHWKGRSFI